MSYDPQMLPDFAAVAEAAERLRDHVQRTPVLTSSTADAESGARFYFKCENLQRVGVFKFRGAYNALAQLSAAQRRAGVVAFSSGNHAQAVALAARLLGMPATIVMPHDSAAGKLAATRGYGAEIVSYDRYHDDREVLASRLASERGLTLIPPFDHPHVIAGQGTAALELFEEVGELDDLFVCLGGGGLLSGSALAAGSLSPRCRIYGAEPAAGDDGQRSLREGRRVRIDTPHTIADGAQTQQLGEYTFELIRRHVDDIVTVTDAALVDAMRFFATRMKLVVEPTGCLGFAAARQLGAELAGRRVGVILSGGNVDMARFAQLLGD